jgi:hypothetical protein
MPVKFGASRMGLQPWSAKVVLTAITIGWLLVQGAAGLRQTSAPYPVTGFSMFSTLTDGRLVQYELVGVDLEGEVIEVDHADYGLTELQLKTFVVRNIGSSPEDTRPGSAPRLERMAGIYAERGGEDLRDLTVIRIDHAIDRDEPERHVVTSWSRS